MTIESAQAVLDRMEADSAFAERVKDAGSPEASLALLREEGFDVSSGDLRDALLDRYGDQLTPDQLDAIAAGASLDIDPGLAITGFAGGMLMVVIGIAGAVV